MFAYEIIHPTRFVSQRWRNGLGSTIELLKENIPNSEEFSWRISMADVTEDGPFSNFKNYDRTLLLLDGRGITLEFGNGDVASLNKMLDSANFRGEESTHAILHDGPITDFNVMTHRQFCSAKIHISRDLQSPSLRLFDDIILIFALSDLEVKTGSSTVVVPKEHLFQARDSEIEITNSRSSRYIGIQIQYKK